MDQSSFDLLARRLGASISRRSGLAGIAGAIAGLAGISVADANVARPPVDCRSTNMQCISGDECCSGRCIAKADGTSRCSRKTSNRKKKQRSGKGGGGTPTSICTVCASGCPFTTIEDAVAAADSYDIITVGPGEYTPRGEGSGAISVNKSLFISACDPADRPVLYPEGDTSDPIIYVGNVDENNICIGPVNAYIDGLVFHGEPGTYRNAIYAKCDSIWTLVNSDVLHFTDSAYSVISAGASIGLIASCAITANHLTESNTPLLRVFNAAVTIQNTLISGNSANSSMVKLIGLSSTVTLTGTTNIYNNGVIDNTTDGAGVYVSDGCTLAIVDSAQIVNNSGVGIGGGIWADTAATVTGATSSNVNGNTAITCNNFWQINCVIS